MENNKKYYKGAYLFSSFFATVYLNILMNAVLTKNLKILLEPLILAVAIMTIISTFKRRKIYKIITGAKNKKIEYLFYILSGIILSIFYLFDITKDYIKIITTIYSLVNIIFFIILLKIELLNIEK